MWQILNELQAAADNILVLSFLDYFDAF